MNKQLIYGDIGGTKTILQLAEIADGQTHARFTQRYDSAAFATFSDILSDFLRRAATPGVPAAACFAVAGPIAGQQATLTNLPWQISSARIAHEFSIPAVKLINDFEAAALAIESLPSSGLVTLQAGQPHAQAMRVVLGAGTGMGVAWLTPDRTPSELRALDEALAQALAATGLASERRMFRPGGGDPAWPQAPDG